MSDEDRSKRLGRGLSELLGEEAEDYAALDRLRTSKEVSIDLLEPNPFQPRQRFDDEGIEALAASIRENGVLQPILVRRSPEHSSHYQIIAGERRWRAAQRAAVHAVPVVVKELGDSAALEVSLVENVQREDLTPIEEAEGYRRLIDEFAYTQERLAQVLAKSRSHVANTLRLLALPETVKGMLNDGRLTAGHARALITHGEPESLARQIVVKGLNVRQAERLAQGARRARPGAAQPKDPDTAALEADISATLGLKVTISHRRTGRGSLCVRYQNLEQLNEVCRRLCQYMIE